MHVRKMFKNFAPFGRKKGNKKKDKKSQLQSPAAKMVSTTYVMTPSREPPRRAVAASEALLPPPANPDFLTVVLDMDETLLHSEFSSGAEYRQAEEREVVSGEADFIVHIGDDEVAEVYLRPGLVKFLEQASKRFELVVFTAALEEYASPVLDRIDPERKWISHRLYRDATVTYKGQPLVKDLTRLGRPMERIMIVDNNPYAMLASPDNAIPIINYYNNPDDCALKSMMECLDELEPLDDVRPYLKHRFRFRVQLQALVASAGMPHLCKLEDSYDYKKRNLQAVSPARSPTRNVPLTPVRSPARGAASPGRSPPPMP